MASISETPEKTKQPRVKQSRDNASKGEVRGENKHYTGVGATSGMHGKAKGGHPTIRAQEMKGC